MSPARGSATVTHHDDNGTWVIALEGEHDLATTPLLSEHVTDLLPRCTIAVVDLSEATFIDCSVVGWLVRTRDALGQGGNALRIVQGAPDSPAGRIFDTLRLHAELPVYADREAALWDVGAGVTA